ncbi:glycosyltransferase family 2 protein [Microbacterium sp. B24]|uniref:glycosyltransferase family 2 protein n=1 Tax=Microbacterium sp. B24 TaxID=95616 RepID=UPI001EF9E6E9|nr:hypothetical protein [Microbacterium sp. B24]
MPARVHALLVVRPDARVATDIRLDRVLSALAAQARPVDTLTIVLCGPHATDRELQRIAGESAAEAVITADRGTSFAEALALASRRLGGDAVWVLDQDTTPAPDALVVSWAPSRLLPRSRSLQRNSSAPTTTTHRVARCVDDARRPRRRPRRRRARSRPARRQ